MSVEEIPASGDATSVRWRAAAVLAVFTAAFSGFGWAQCAHAQRVGPVGVISHLQSVISAGDEAALRSLLAGSADDAVDALMQRLASIPAESRRGAYVSSVSAVGEATYLYSVSVVLNPVDTVGSTQRFLASPAADPSLADTVFKARPYVVTVNVGSAASRRG